MVYRGKPSAGCEACRKAKKRCTLEQPACMRCVKLRKQCSGYRDTTQLQIQDESESVKLKSQRQSKARQEPAQSLMPTAAQFDSFFNIPTPALTNTDSSSSSDDTTDLPMVDYDPNYDPQLFGLDIPWDQSSQNSLVPFSGFTYAIRPSADDMATSNFFRSFTAAGHWEWMGNFIGKSRQDPCLDLAVRACGMAALSNVENVVMGKDYARAMYVEALGLLNSALRDPKRCKTDEALIAVSLLGYYENLVCDSRESIQSWKAHIEGATQLLKLRGTSQFKTAVGRMLYRETRAQIMVHCIWDDIEPPSFFLEWEPELSKSSPEVQLAPLADGFLQICCDFASVRAKMRYQTISDVKAAEVCSEIDRRMIQWAIDAQAAGPMWRYEEVEVPDSPHVWNGMVHAYSCHPVPGVWNMFRSIRIMVTRSRELLCKRLPFSQEEREEQKIYFRKVRRQMTDEICAGIPSVLGHAGPGIYNSPCVLISAYGSIWPLFFAGTCALERLGTKAWDAKNANAPGRITSAASAQAAWIIGRMDYISKHVGLRWAGGIAAALKGDFRIHDGDILGDDDEVPVWLEKVEKSGRGPRVLLEPEGFPLQHEGPIWVGRETGENTRPPGLL